MEQSGRCTVLNSLFSVAFSVEFTAYFVHKLHMFPCDVLVLLCRMKVAVYSVTVIIVHGVGPKKYLSLFCVYIKEAELKSTTFDDHRKIAGHQKPRMESNSLQSEKLKLKRNL